MNNDPFMKALAEAAAAEPGDDGAFLSEVEFSSKQLDAITAAAAEAYGPPLVTNIAAYSRRRALAGALAAMAASAAVVAFWPTAKSPLPGYQFQLIGGDERDRGRAAPDREGAPVPVAAPNKITVFSLGSRFEILLQPTKKVGDAVAMRAVYAIGDGAWAMGGAVEQSKTGSFRLVGEATEVFATRTGDVRIVCAVARPGDLPSVEALARLGVDETIEGVQIERREVRIIPGG